MTSPIAIKRNYITSKLYRWFLKFSNSPTTSKFTLVGDSTSDIAGPAGAITPYLSATYCQTGDTLAGFNTSTNFPNFGLAGNTLDNWINGDPNASRGLNPLIASAPDLVIFSYGINDTRQNLVTVSQLKALLIKSIEAIRLGLPNCDIVLRMPNTFESTATSSLILLTGPSAPVGGYANVPAAAQGQSDIIYQAYSQLKDYWDNVYLLDTQNLIFGRTPPVYPNALYNDEIHPFYTQIVDELVKIIGYKAPYSQGLADAAITKSYTQPWLHYPRVCENTKYFTKQATGRYDAQSGVSIDFSCIDSREFAANIAPGDVIVIGDIFLGIIPRSVVTNILTTTTLKLTFTIPTNTITGGIVSIYRHKYNFVQAAEPYIKSKNSYLREANVVSTTSSGLLVLLAYPSVYGAPNIPSHQLQLSKSDTVIFNDGTVLNLTTATYLSSGIQNNYVIQISGNYAAYINTQVLIAGTHAYEDPNPTKSWINLTAYPSGTIVKTNGDLGAFNGALLFNSVEGEVYMPHELLRAFADQTITNTTTKTPFSGYTIPAGALLVPEWFSIKAWLTVSGAAIAGTLTLSVEVNGTTIVTTPAININASASDELIKLETDIFFRFIGSSGTLSGQGVSEYIGTGSYPMKRTTYITSFNLAVAATVTISAQFSVANPANAIVLRGLKMNSAR